jgi:hypothetical protein
LTTRSSSSSKSRRGSRSTCRASPPRWYRSPPTTGHDDPETWDKIKADGDAAILGVGHCSTCAPAVATHAITLDTKYGIPTVALHTDKFDKVVASVRKMGGLADAPTVFVPQPVMGKTADELRAYVDGKDPITGGSVMQEIVAGLTTQLSAV